MPRQRVIVNHIYIYLCWKTARKVMLLVWPSPESPVFPIIYRQRMCHLTCDVFWRAQSQAMVDFLCYKKTTFDDCDQTWSAWSPLCRPLQNFFSSFCLKLSRYTSGGSFVRGFCQCTFCLPHAFPLWKSLLKILQLDLFFSWSLQFEFRYEGGTFFLIWYYQNEFLADMGAHTRGGQSRAHLKLLWPWSPTGIYLVSWESGRLPKSMCSRRIPGVCVLSPVICGWLHYGSFMVLAMPISRTEFIGASVVAVTARLWLWSPNQSVSEEDRGITSTRHVLTLKPQDLGVDFLTP